VAVTFENGGDATQVLRAPDGVPEQVDRGDQ
jgi:hypothetical protein